MEKDDWVDLPVDQKKDDGPDDWVDVSEPGIADNVLHGVGMVGRAVDAYGGDASTRAAISALQKGKNPAQAFVDQYGDSESAPTGKQIAIDAGVSDGPMPSFVKKAAGLVRDYTPAGIAYKNLAPEGLKSRIETSTPADVAGLGVEMAASPSNLIPFAKPIMKGTSTVADLVANAVRKSYLGRKGGQLMDATGRGVAGIGEWATGVPKQDIVTYATEAPEIKKMMRESGGSISDAADTVRNDFQKGIKSAKREANSEISQAIKSSSPEKSVDIKPVLDQLQEIKSRLNPKLEIEDVAQIDKLANRLNDVADSSGLVSPQDIQDVVHFLQKRGKPAFGGSAIFNDATDAQKAAKQASSEAVDLRNQFVPGASGSFDKLEKMRQVQAAMNKNLIKPKTPEGALLAAGSGVNDRNSEVLKELGDLTGTDMQGPAKRLSAARYFHNPSLSPVDSTGKAIYRQGIGAGIGAAIAHILDADPKIGAAIGAASTSPAALKALIDSSRAVTGLPADMVEKLRNLTPNQLMTAFTAEKASRTEEFSERGEMSKQQKMREAILKRRSP